MKFNEIFDLIIVLIKLAFVKVYPLFKFLFHDPTSIVAVIAILAFISVSYKVFFPGIKFKIVSCYYTLSKEKIGLFILKIQTTSNVSLIIDEFKVNILLSNGKTYEMEPFSPRLKATIPVMCALNGHQSSYKLLKPLGPDLRIKGIKEGNNEYYISLRTKEAFVDCSEISEWSFELKWRQHMLAIPSIPFLSRKTITVKQPEEKDLYFDDLLFEKITDEEVREILNNL